MMGELNNLFKVWFLIFLSASYCYATTKLVPKVSFTITTGFFITWLSSFKLLLLAFGNGPLSSPNLPFIRPKTSPRWPKTHRPNSEDDKVGLRPLSLKNFLFLFFLVLLGDHRDKFPRDVVLFFICIFVYIGLQMTLGVIAIVGQVLLRTKIDPPFHDPYYSTSLQDFWGHRWNGVSSNSLRSTIFYPTFNYTSRVLDRIWAGNVALVVTFIVSDLMHEILFYYLGRVRFKWGTPFFFLLHGLLDAAESTFKRKNSVKWRLPQKISGPLIFGFSLCTFMWMVLPELLEHKVDDRLLGEYAPFVNSSGISSKIGV